MVPSSGHLMFHLMQEGRSVLHVRAGPPGVGGATGNSAAACQPLAGETAAHARMHCCSCAHTHAPSTCTQLMFWAGGWAGGSPHKKCEGRPT